MKKYSLKNLWQKSQDRAVCALVSLVSFISLVWSKTEPAIERLSATLDKSALRGLSLVSETINKVGRFTMSFVRRWGLTAKKVKQVFWCSVAVIAILYLSLITSSGQENKAPSAASETASAVSAEATSSWLWGLRPSWTTFWVIVGAIVFAAIVVALILLIIYGQGKKNARKSASHNLNGPANTATQTTAAGVRNPSRFRRIVFWIKKRWTGTVKGLKNEKVGSPLLYIIGIAIGWLFLTQAIMLPLWPKTYDWIWVENSTYQWAVPLAIIVSVLLWIRKSFWTKVFAILIMVFLGSHMYQTYFQHPASESVRMWIAEREAKEAKNQTIAKAATAPRQYEVCWQKPPEVGGHKPKLRNACYDAYIIRNDEFVLEFIVVWIDNYQEVKARFFWDKTAGEHGVWSQPTPAHNPLHGDWWLASDGRDNFNGWLRDRSRPGKEGQEKIQFQLRLKLVNGVDPSLAIPSDTTTPPPAEPERKYQDRREEIMS